jgi:hypothetical protein
MVGEWEERKAEGFSRPLQVMFLDGFWLGVVYRLTFYKCQDLPQLEA